MTRSGRPGILLATAVALIAPAASIGQQAARTPIASTPHFALFSDFETNLNDALVNAGVDRKFRRPELFHAGDEAPCFEKLSAEARAGWNEALDWYAKIVSPGNWDGREQHAIRVDLAGFDEELKSDADRQLVAIARAFRAAAAPAYRACRWPAQDDANRRWIAALSLRLAAHEETLAERLEKVYRQRWTGLPLPVDVVQTVNWAGANSILRDAGGGHLLVSVENLEPYPLEVVFHEASHLLMGRDAPLQRALQGAADAAGYRLPEDLWHAVLFSTTGEVVRRHLAETGTPGYRPMVEGIFDRGTWSDYRAPVADAWLPYVAGQRTLEESSVELIAALKKKEAERKPAKP